MGEGVAKRGQIKLSFGMIFSIILIVVFLSVAFYAIRTFFSIQESAEVGVFVSDLQADIDRAWRSTESSQTREYRLPSEIESVCFIDFTEGVGGFGEFSHLYPELKFYDVGNRNLFFYPVGSVSTEGVEVKNIDLDGITATNNPYCIKSKNGKLELHISKSFREALVKIGK